MLMENGRLQDVFIMAMRPNTMDLGKPYPLDMSWDLFSWRYMGSTNLAGDTRGPLQVLKVVMKRTGQSLQPL